MNDIVIVIPAISALRAYIVKNYDGSVAAFARDNKLDQADLSKLLRQTNNRGQRVTVAYADRIEKATRGVVGIRLWLPVARRAS
jgi:hypothetical protein